MGPVYLYNDEPTIEDGVGRHKLVQTVGEAVARCQPPQVFGIHGDWGCGKTSFLHQLHLFLAGRCPQQIVNQGGARMCKAIWGNDWKSRDDLTVIWFEAWRYQYEDVPIVALLQEIRTQLPWYSKFLGKAGKIGEVTIRSALLALEDLTKKIGIQASKIEEVGEKWEKDHLATALPSHAIREHLSNALGSLLGKKDNRIVVLIDDLDRCEAEAAYRLLEGIKIYLNLPNSVFVLGMNQRVIESAIAKHVPGEPKALLAREYLEKLCQDIWHLPLVRKPEEYLKGLLDKAGTNPAIASRIASAAGHYKCLPANPRRIKTFANVLQRFLHHLKYDELLQGGAEIHRAWLLLVMAGLYLDYHRMYRILEGNPAFFGEIQRWARGEKVDHEVFRDVKAVYRAVTTDRGQVEPIREPEFVPAYPDPAESNVFRIQRLVIDLGPVIEDEVRKFLLE